jgi:DNA-binding transcriptional LysR family regulator
MLSVPHLRSLAAIARHGTFTAAADALGRTHSAVSLHIKALEAHLGARLIDRGARPPALTPAGAAVVEQIARLERVLQDIEAAARSDALRGRLQVGVVPSALIDLAPPALAALRLRHPEIEITIRAGLSGALARALGAGELDAAVLTAPDVAPDAVRLRSIVDEPLIVIAPPDAPPGDDRALLTGRPFIWFSRQTWAGQQIERRLADRGLAVEASMEVDSLEAIAALVRNGLGASIVPDRGQAADLRRAPFGEPPLHRRLALMSPARQPKAALVAAFHACLCEAAAARGAR